MDKWSEHALHKRGYPMANKHIKKCLTGETPINNRLARIRKTNQTKCWQRCGATRTVMFWWWQYKLIPSLWKSVWYHLLTRNTDTPYDQQFHSQVYTKEKCVPLCTKRRVQESEQQHTHNSPKLRTTRMDKYIVIHSYNGVVQSNENKRITGTCNNVFGSHKHNVEAKQPDVKWIHLC